MDLLLKLVKVKNSVNVDGLRKLYNDIEASVRNLKSLKVKHKYTDHSVYMEALCLPVICSPLQGRNFYYWKNRKKSIGGLVASKSIFGWVLSSPISLEKSTKNTTKTVFTSQSMHCKIESEIDELKKDLNKFWSVETIESPESCVMYQFERDLIHNGERYITKLSFKTDHDFLPGNYNICKKRLANLKVRLNDKQLVTEYNQIYIDYEKNNIIEKVSESDIFKEPGCVHYLPHKPVIRRDKDTTKIRAVFYASYSTTGPSLNDCLNSGPNLLPKIFDILLKFRFNAIGIIADIKQAFLNIEISPEHRDYLSSPFLLNATLKHHLNKCIKHDAEFELKKWIRNDHELHNYFNKKETNQSENSKCILKIDELKFFERIEWDILKDEFVFEFEELVKNARMLKFTKRNILKMAASFFDPLNILTPITSRVKTIFQLICRNKSGWDEIVTEAIELALTDFLKDLELLSFVKIPRFVFKRVNESSKRVQLHGFCDSSKLIYCAVIYLVVETSLGLNREFLVSKSRVSPLKELSIPRLELLEVALYWIKGKERTWKPWVENRVNAIRKVVDRENWNHISGELNPADFPSRISNFIDFGHWLKRPEVLLNINKEKNEFK
ncbi:uncharacterized protein LOC124818127 [Hydra vulgaris]|uniref:uncharacterized protein LOC124818127 n=1 Tax=Hydra vulgaris TaxID=6087 RepID=UPI0032EA7D98